MSSQATFRPAPLLEAVVAGRRYPVFEREFFIRPKRVSTFDNARGGPYRYAYYDPQLDRKVSFPLPFTREIAALYAAGLV